MNYIRHLNAFFSFVRSDNRLTSSHVSLYIALFQYWNFNRFQNPFPIYRDNILRLCKIGSKSTYHKCLKELHQAQYIVYHPSPTRFQPVKISMVRLDNQECKTKYKQLDLFAVAGEKEPHPVRGNDISTDRIQEPMLGGTKTGTGSVPILVPPGTENDTGTVPKPGRTIKQNNKQENSVGETPTKVFEKNKELSQKINALGGGPKTGHAPLLSEVEAFFTEHRYPAKEAQLFYYYNQGKGWMLTDKMPITDWRSLAHKWMLNMKQTKDEGLEMEKALQGLYELYLEGHRINKLLVPEMADHLRLEITPAILAEARLRRINQLSGSNERSEVQLWTAYMQEEMESEIVKRDTPTLLSLATRVAVLRYFQQAKQGGKTCIV